MEGQHFKGRATFDYCDDPDRSIRLTLDEWRRVCPSVGRSAGWRNFFHFGGNFWLSNIQMFFFMLAIGHRWI